MHAVIRLVFNTLAILVLMMLAFSFGYWYRISDFIFWLAILLVVLTGLVRLNVWPGVRLSLLEQKWKSRKAQGRCLRCGYDLRATPGRCPECGEGPERGLDFPP